MNLFPDAKILEVDLTKGYLSTRTLPGETYRLYPGGSALGVYLILQEMDPLTDAFDPKALMVWSVSPLTGLGFAGSTRMNIAAKSPLTGGMGDSQCGGFFPWALKSNGWDAILFRGRSEKPVYLHIDGEKTMLRDATRMWGKITGVTEDLIYVDLGTKNVEIAQIGPAGENQVLYAAVINMCNRANGRNGLGAVMGAKNLKAVAVAKGKPIVPFMEAPFRALAKEAKPRLESINKGLNNTGIYGTSANLAPSNATGLFATRNWQYSWQEQEHAEKISGRTMYATVLKNRDTCYACAVRCKRQVEIAEKGVETRYGGPEYETICTFGSYCGVDNLNDICLANQLCNQYGLDTISAGATVAFVMECFEKKLLTSADTGGIEFTFGDGAVYEKILPMIALREGFGARMAQGSSRLAKEIGSEAETLFMGVKHQELPAHMPQRKPSVGIIYAVNPYGADHQSCEHDPYLSSPWDSLERQRAAQLGLWKSYEDTFFLVDDEKVRFAFITQRYYSILDTLCLCQFPWALCWGIWGPTDLIKFCEYGIGWETSLQELMLVGERRIAMMRWFNSCCGFTSKDDVLPERMFEKIPTGPQQGRQLLRDDFYEGIKTYYQFTGLDEEGRPRPEMLRAISLGWLNEK